MDKPRIIAFYLPQFYPTPENDEWWEPGFTEWTNVARAKPLFRGHYQPRIPQELSFYDLRVPAVRERQAELAREAGIEGFCYWHYWFSGKRLLDRVFTEVIETGKPDFPFCLCWANHSWYQKTWDPNKPDKLLIEQEYPGDQDYINHFNALLPAFKDHRYMKYKGKLIFGIFNSDEIDTFYKMKSIWDKLAKENNLPGFYFFGFCQGEHRLHKTISRGYDDVVYDHMATVYKSLKPTIFSKLMRRIFHRPITLNYSRYVRDSIKFFKEHPSLVPCMIPNFDHSPRSAERGIIMVDSTPDRWYQYCRDMRNHVDKLHSQEQLIFIKAWNEWGEGNYMEPDMRFGRGYINATKKAFGESDN